MSRRHPLRYIFITETHHYYEMIPPSASYRDLNPIVPLSSLGQHSCKLNRIASRCLRGILLPVLVLSSPGRAFSQIKTEKCDGNFSFFRWSGALRLFLITLALQFFIISDLANGTISLGVLAAILNCSGRSSLLVSSPRALSSAQDLYNTP